MKRSSKVILAAGAVALVGGVVLAVPPLLALAGGSGSAAQSPTPTPASESEPTVPNAYNPGAPESCSTWSAIRFAPNAEGATSTSVSLEGPLLTDSGSREFAAGEVTRDAEGRLATYTVAAGDAGLAIGERFCVDYITVFQFNHIYPMPQPGDVLSLYVDESVPFPLDPIDP